MATNILQSAIDNWPEDEASIVMRNADDAIDAGYDTIEEIYTDYCHDVDHMTKVFIRETDSNELIQRFFNYMIAF